VIRKEKDPRERVFSFSQRSKNRRFFPLKIVLQTAGFFDKIKKSPPRGDLLKLDNYQTMQNKVVR